MRSTNRHSFIRSLKRKGFKEEIVIKIGLHDLVTSTTLESNKSLKFLPKKTQSAYVRAGGKEVVAGFAMLARRAGRRTTAAINTQRLPDQATKPRLKIPL